MANEAHGLMSPTPMCLAHTRFTLILCSSVSCVAAYLQCDLHRCVAVSDDFQQTLA